MKKVSISLFAVLAIVLATSSAFTAKKFAINYEVRGILQATQPPVGAAPLWYYQNGQFIASKASAFTSTELDTYQSNRCESSSKVCLAHIQVNDATNPPAVALQSTRPGDFE